jgi:hypothetical protein
MVIVNCLGQFRVDDEESVKRKFMEHLYGVLKN